MDPPPLHPTSNRYRTQVAVQLTTQDQTGYLQHSQDMEGRFDVFPCHYCPSTLPTKRLIERHMSNTHGGLLPCPCTLCPRGFFTDSALKRHVQDHMSHETFVCAYCDNTFKRKQYLISHLRGFHKLFPCLSCRAVFQSSDLLGVHLNNCG